MSDDLVKDGLSKLLTQYRESDNMKAILTFNLEKVVEVIETIESVFDAFDIDKATGEQLTFLGKILGWPREHCAGRLKTVFGFVAHEGRGIPVSSQPVAGWREGEWLIRGSRFESAAIVDDDLYRRFLKSRIIALDGDYSLVSMREAVRLLIGDTGFVLRYLEGVIQIATGRVLRQDERARVHLFEQVLPVAPGVRLEVWETSTTPFGFGPGWGGFSRGKEQGIDEGKVFGFVEPDGSYGQVLAGWNEGSWNGRSSVDSYLQGEWPVRLW